MDLSRGAGTGKSTLLRTIVQYIERMTGLTTLTMVATHTNSASSHFLGGQTLHRLFCINVPRCDSKNQSGKDVRPLAGDQLAAIQLELKNIILIIIDSPAIAPA